MARGVQLIQLIAALRAEIGHSVDPAVGVDSDAEMKQLIRRHQETLYDEYDWPFLRVTPSFTLQAGQRYYGMPTGLNIERIERVALWHGGTPVPLTRGIGFDEFAVHDSDSDERTDPVRAWDIRDVSGTEQIEVWPIPATNGTTTNGRVQFMGIRDLNALTAEADTADLDDIMIVLFAAAELLARSKSADAPAKLSIAQTRFNRMKGRVKGGSPITGIGTAGNAERRSGPVIRVNRN